MQKLVYDFFFFLSERRADKKRQIVRNHYTERIVENNDEIFLQHEFGGMDFDEPDSEIASINLFITLSRGLIPFSSFSVHICHIVVHFGKSLHTLAFTFRM